MVKQFCFRKKKNKLYYVFILVGRIAKYACGFESCMSNMYEDLFSFHKNLLFLVFFFALGNKVFSSVHTMTRHKTSIHDRQVRYGCNICGRYFFRKDKLTSHMVYHQDFDSYVCCFCTVGCKSRMLMRQHLKRE